MKFHIGDIITDAFGETGKITHLPEDNSYLLKRWKAIRAFGITEHGHQPLYLTFMGKKAVKYDCSVEQIES